MSTKTKAARELDRMLRPVRPMTQQRLAKELGVTQQAVSSWLRGISKPDEDRRDRIAELTGVAVDGWEIPVDDESGTDVSIVGEHALSDIAKQTGS